MTMLDTTLDPWMAGREPPPPEPLAAALRGVAPTVGSPGAGFDHAPGAAPSLADGLASAARDRLKLALARPGRVRESAYRLLEADALFTYACEAALERGDATAVLRRILALASG